jgi:hypothetical protein
MSSDPHIPRFFSYLSLFTFMMVILVTANNYLLMFVGWEGIFSLVVLGFLYLLYSAFILFNYTSKFYSPTSYSANFNTPFTINLIYTLNSNKFNLNNRLPLLCLRSQLQLQQQLKLKLRSYSSINKLSKKYKEECELTSEQKEVLVGVILGDGCLEKLNDRSNTRLRVENVYPEQELFIIKLREIFDSIVNMPPKVLTRTDKRSSKITQSIYFWTLSLPCLNYYHSLFYNNKIKRIPSNIRELLTERGLAFWLMGDGMYRKDREGVVICTDSFTLEDNELLKAVLIEKFGLAVSVQKRRENVYRLYIQKKSVSKLIELVKPYFIKSMLYRLGL